MNGEASAVMNNVDAPAKRSKPWLAADLRKKHLIGLPVSSRMMDALERYRLSVGEDVSRPEAVRLILSKFLKEQEYFK